VRVSVAKRSIAIPRGKKGALIGAGGQVIKSLEEVSGGRILISKDESTPSLKVTITGPDEAALELIINLIEKKLGKAAVQRLALAAPELASESLRTSGFVIRVCTCALLLF
jgi:hypothetical protein